MRVATDERRPLTFAETLPGGLLLTIAFLLFCLGAGGFGISAFVRIRNGGTLIGDIAQRSGVFGGEMLVYGFVLLCSMTFSALGLYMLRRR
jgi:hypothetical protein